MRLHQLLVATLDEETKQGALWVVWTLLEPTRSFDNVKIAGSNQSNSHFSWLAVIFPEGHQVRHLLLDHMLFVWVQALLRMRWEGSAFVYWYLNATNGYLYQCQYDCNYLAADSRFRRMLLVS